MAEFKNLGDLIRRDRDLTKVAIIDLGGEEVPCEYTYAELDAHGDGRGARARQARASTRGDRVAILSANRAEYLAAYYGIMRAGFVAVPVNYRFPAQDHPFHLADAGAKLVFCDRKRAARIVRMTCRSWCSATRATRASTAFSIPASSRPSCRQPNEPAMFLYTSGSTGTPKGVVLSHQSHIWVVETRLEGRISTAIAI